MNYYALFLNSSSYFEKCLTMIRFISNPQSYSPPHITLRLFEGSNSKLEYVRDMKVAYLNVIEPGYFNVDEKRSPYVVYMRCESEELEKIEYKPDFPFSRLHITLYEGDDIYYAEKLFLLLKKRIWNFKLLFEEPRNLTEKKIGSKKNNGSFIRIIEQCFNEISIDVEQVIAKSTNNVYKLNLVEKILFNLDAYLAQQPPKVKRIDSYFYNSDVIAISQSANFIDASEENITYKNNQLSFDSLHSEIAPYVEKPVQDAIYVTPPEYAREMAECALAAFKGNSNGINFGDSAIGTGALFLALKNIVDEVNRREGTRYSFSSAIGVDIDEGMAKEAFVRYGKRGLTVIYGDAISQDIDLSSKRNLMLVNPPFNRHEDIPEEYRRQAREFAKAQTGIEIMGDAGLYVYHLLIMDKWLNEDGIAVWLLPSIFLQSRYGSAIRQYLLNNVQLKKMHIYDERKAQFDNTLISTTIVAFKKAPPSKISDIAVSYGESLTQPYFEKRINRKLFEVSENWRKIIFNGEKKDDHCKYSQDIIFEHLFDIKRGLATGANSFFVLARKKAQELQIPEIALKPILPKARYLKERIVAPKSDGYPDVEPQLALIDCDLDEIIIKEKYPQFFDYLQRAKVAEKDGKAIIERTLIKSRQPWYKQERREAPLFLLTYMGRNKEDLPPLYFILNKSKATALNTYLLLYPKAWLMNLLEKDNSLHETILAALDKSAEKIIIQQTRVYSGGLQKLEPNELKKLPIIDLPIKVVEALKVERTE